jgi:hypothetical protein
MVIIKDPQPPMTTKSSPVSYQYPAKPEDKSQILTKMVGIYVKKIVKPPETQEVILDHLLQIEIGESVDEFRLRRELTEIFYDKWGSEINLVTLISLVYMITKKSKLGLTYPPEVEAVISSFLEGL